MHFEMEFFVNRDHFLQGYISKQKAFFSENGETALFYTDSSIDVLTEENQQKYLDALKILQGDAPCSHCDSNWIVTGSLTSWYLAWLDYVNMGHCDSICAPSSCKSGEVVNEMFAKQCLSEFLRS